MRTISLLIALLVSLTVFAQEGRNCGTMEELNHQLQHDPEMALRMEAIERFTRDFVERNPNEGGRMVVTIPVVFHIIHNGDAYGTNENISDELVLAQLEQLNHDFALLNADAGNIPSLFQSVAANTEIQFCLAQRKPDGTATTGINRVNGGQATWTSSQINSTIKPATIWDRNQYLNIWSVAFGGSSSGLLGYAQFPGGAASTDGIVCAYFSIGSLAMPNPAGGNYALGRTATHEIGHWLNLRHIWGDATCGNDLVADTPVHNASNSGCPAYPHLSTCTGTPVEMTMNYMDYTFDACMNMFSAGQKTRMQAVLQAGGARASLLNSLGCSPPAVSCGTPSSLSTTNVGSASATLNWSAVTGATSYNVRYRVTGTTTWTTSTSSTTSLAISGLNPQTTYEFQVQAVCAITGSYSPSSNFTTLPSVSCGIPTGLSNTDVTLTTAVISWSAVPGATYYNYRYRIIGSSAWTSGDIGLNTVSLTGLASGTQYEFQVRAVCISTPSAFSSSHIFTTLQEGGCAVPTGLVATNVTATSVSVSWAAVFGSSNYNIRWRPQGASSWQETVVSVTSFTANNLLPATVYEFQVKANCIRSLSAFSPSLLVTTASVSGCSTPMGLAATNVTFNSATITWLAVPGSSSYTIRWRSQGATLWNQMGSFVNSFTINNLLANTTYEFEVQAVCGAALSSFAMGTFTTLQQPSCGLAANLNASAITTTTAILSWSTVSGASAYNVRWRVVNTVAWSATVAGSNSIAVSNLAEGSFYEFQVQAICGVNTGDYTNAAFFQTLGGGSCSDLFEPNESASSSLPLSPVNVEFQAVIGSPSDNDFFRFANTPEQKNIRIELTNLPANYAIQLFRDNILLATNQLPGTINKTIIYNRGPVSSNYYVRVYSNNGESVPNQCYTLKIRINENGLRTVEEGVVVEGDQNVDFNVFPNPAQSTVLINPVKRIAAETEEVVLNVLDMSGRQLISQTFLLIGDDQHLFTLDVSSLPSGMYVVQLVQGEAAAFRKLLIAR